MAQQALSAQAIAGGRFTLGIGLSHQIVIEGMFGLSFAKPYSHMKEYLAVLGPLIRTGSVSHAGEEYRVNAQLAVPGATPCPILVAALAPKMLALAGREADGTITWMTGMRTIREHTVPRIREAAAAAGRPAPRVVVGFPIAVTRDVAAARESAARVFQIYGALPSYRRMLDLEGAAGPGDVAIVGDESPVGEELDRLEGELQPSGYLVGDRFSVADLAAAALLAPLVFPPEWPYPLPGPLPARAAALSDAFAARRGVRWVREMYRRHRGTSAALAA